MPPIVHIVSKEDFLLLKNILLRLVSVLSSSGTRHMILVIGKEGQALQTERHINFLHLPSGWLSAVNCLRVWLIRQQVCCVHIHDISDVSVVTWASLAAGVSMNITLHRAFEQAIPSFLWQRYKNIICAWDYVKSTVLKRNRIPLLRLKCIADGMSAPILPTSPQSFRQQFSATEKTFVIGNIGRLDPEHDHASLLKAFRKIIQKKADAQLWIVGSGPLHDTLRTLVASFECEGRVFFLQDDQIAALSECDCLAQTTIQSDFYEPIVTAMAMGKPVIATKIANHAELVEEGLNGLLVPCAFPERLEAAIMRLCVNRSLTKDMGQHGFARFDERLNIEKTSQKYLELYPRN